MLDNLRQDLCYGFRQLVRAPLFTLVAAVSLAVGITVAVFVFSLLNSVLFKPLPVNEPDAVVHVYSSPRGLSYRYGRSSYADLQDIQRSDVFEELAAHSYTRTVVAANGREPRRVGVGFVSPNFFQALGMDLIAGRQFTASGHEQEIIISERYRRQTFPPNEPVLGAIVRVNQVPLTIVGVAAPGFRGFELHTSLVGWVPAQQWSYVYGRGSDLEDRSRRSYGMVGRLAPGQTIASARIRLAATSTSLAALYPQVWRDEGGAALQMSLLTHRQSIIKPDDSDSIAAIAGITALVLAVLLLSCTNVAGLLLGRAISRRHEVAVRLTLGASRARLTSQLTVEALLLAALGALLGFCGAQWANKIAARTTFLDGFDLTPDWRVLLATCLIALVCTMMFGITPIGQALRVDVKAGLSGQNIVGERGGVRGRLIAVQVCVSCLLVLFAVSGSRGVRSKLYSDPGFTLNGLLVAELDLLGFRWADTVGKRQFVTTTFNTLTSIAGVQNATIATTLPLTFSDQRWDTNLQLPGGGTMVVRYNAVTENYFETMGIRIVQGRPLRAEDAQAGNVIVVNKVLADKYGSGVVGRTLTIGAGRQMVVVGVAENVKHRAIDRQTEPYVYEAAKSSSWSKSSRVYMIARVRPDLQQRIGAQLVRSVRDRHPDRVPPSVETLRTAVERWIAPQRFIANLAFGIGATELALATIGLYSMLLYALLSRSREVGLRMALGAGPRHAAFTIIADGLRFVAIGGTIGLLLCVSAAKFAARTFTGAKADDPMPFLFVLLTIALVTTAAAYIPARRAARIEPMSALRHD
jgi:putative ABC transport system permease protein